MNLAHRRLCGSSLWQTTIRTRVLPWALQGVDLGVHVLEIGPGYGAATDLLRTATRHVTCVELDPALAARLKARMPPEQVSVRCEDATRMSIPDATFDSAVCLTMLHHVPSPSLQNQLFVEVARVLRPGGTFAGFDTTSSPLVRLLHLFDTMVLVNPGTLRDRLAAAGFADIRVDVRARGFRFRARRAA